jgi:hypothetical protein
MIISNQTIDNLLLSLNLSNLDTLTIKDKILKLIENKLLECDIVYKIMETNELITIDESINIAIKEQHKHTCGSCDLYEKINHNQKSISSDLVLHKPLPKNPYISSITGQYAFNLKKIPSFKVYFWKSTDINLNKAIKNNLTRQNANALDWPEFYQTQTIDALNQYTTFLNKSKSIINNYQDSNIVCVLMSNYSNNTFAAATGPKSWLNPESNNKSILYLNDSVTNAVNIKKGGLLYHTLIHEFGHIFGLGHPHDKSLNNNSTIIPGINTDSVFNYPAIAAYLQNSIFNTVMSYIDTQFFLPEDEILYTDLIGYSETLMPLDILALRWLYNIKGTSNEYVASYGATIINPSIEESKSQIIVGKKHTLTFGENTQNVSFYFSKQSISSSNIEPFVYEYNRVLEKDWGFYPRDIDSTISQINFNNSGVSNIFIGQCAINNNLLVILNSTELNIYILDSIHNYKVDKKKYKLYNKKTKYCIKIFKNNPISKINIFFQNNNITW